MAELALNERLQPALLDRLIDDERTVASVTLVIDTLALERLKFPEKALVDVLNARGLRLQSREVTAESLQLSFIASSAHANTAQLRSLMVSPPGAPQGVPLESFASIQSRSMPNIEIESPERRLLSMRRLRECVLRDLGWLFNSLNLDSFQSLDDVPEVASSVLNYGLPSFAGRATASVDPLQAAARLRRAVELFEPRLSSVRVKPELPGEGEADGTLEFTIEAQLWGYPLPQQIELHTKIDTLTGDVAVSEGRRARSER